MSSTRFNNNPNFATHNLCGLNLSTMKNKQNSSDDAKYLSLKSALKDMDFVCFSETKTPDTSFDYNYFFPLGKKFKQAAYSCNGQQDGLFILFNPNTFIHHSSVIHQRGRLIETKLKFITSGDQFIFFSLYLPTRNTSLSLNILEQLSIYLNLALTNDPNVKIIILGDLNMPALRFPQTLPKNSPTDYYHKLVSKYKLIDTALAHSCTGPTWRGRGEKAHLYSVLDYCHTSSNVVVRDVAYFSVAKSDHVVLTFNNKPSFKKIGKQISDKLFDSKEFTSHISPIMQKSHELFTQENPSLLQNNDAQYFISWLEAMLGQLDNLNKAYQSEKFTSTLQKEKNFRKKLNKALKDLAKAETIENKKIIDDIRSSHIEEIQRDLDLINMRHRVKSAIHFGRSNSFSFKKYKSQSERKIHAIKKVSNPNTLLTGEQEIVNELADFHQVKTSYPDLTADLKNCNLEKKTANQSSTKFWSCIISH